MEKLLSSAGSLGWVAVIIYFVIKELFSFIKGESKETLKKVNTLVSSIEKIEAKLDKIDIVQEQVGDWYREKEFIISRVKVLIKQTEDLWDWHNKEDDDGVKIWYVRSSLQSTLDRLNSVLATQNEFLPKIVTKINTLEEELECLSEELRSKE